MNFTTNIVNETFLELIKDDEETDDLSVDITTVILVTSVILQMVKLLYKCYEENKDKDQILGSTYKMSLLTKLRINRILRKEIGAKKYRRHRKKFFELLELRGQKLTIEELETLFKENIDEYRKNN